MNRRNTCGIVLTSVGLGGFLLTAILVLNLSRDANNTNALVALGVISVVAFMVGINLVKVTKHSA